MYTVYKHTNLINNKVYIGQTSYSNPEQRWVNMDKNILVVNIFIRQF